MQEDLLINLLLQPSRLYSGESEIYEIPAPTPTPTRAEPAPRVVLPPSRQYPEFTRPDLTKEQTELLNRVHKFATRLLSVWRLKAGVHWLWDGGEEECCRIFGKIALSAPHTLRRGVFGIDASYDQVRHEVGHLLVGHRRHSTDWAERARELGTGAKLMAEYGY